MEIYPGFSAAEVLYKADGGVAGIATADMGLEKDGTPKATFARGMELRGRQTLFAEGARGSCSEALMEHFGLREAPPHLRAEAKKEADPQSFALGVKEVWQIPEEKCQPGLVLHSWGWPLTDMARSVSQSVNFSLFFF